MNRTSQRLSGLELLAAYGLPVPRWTHVVEADDLATPLPAKAPNGWTVRTVRKDGAREIGSYFANHVVEEALVPLINARLQRHGDVEGYIVYPSWQPVAFLNILCDWEGYTVEGALDEKTLVSRGHDAPHFTCRVDRYERHPAVAEVPERLRSGTQKILSWCRKLPFDTFYTEAAITGDQGIMFYELLPVDKPLVRPPAA
ncbi:MAG: hypothetical protein M9939_15655 [Mesorhizobium sp.]|nr:hypothetical protein [Mesorhizobium sp.]MCO5162568.1 hypothetical protein [Mesorhizobium sp.]